MIPEPVKAKIEAFVTEMIEKADELKTSDGALSRMTVLRIGGTEYEINCQLKVRK